MPKRSPYPFVTRPRLKRHRSGQTTWVATETNPLTGKRSEIALFAQGVTSESEALAWARERSAQLVERLRRHQRGSVENAAAPVAGIRIDDAVSDYLHRSVELADSTIVVYEAALYDVKLWADNRGHFAIARLTPADLEDLRDWVIARPRRAAPGVKPPSIPRSAHSINRELRAIRTWLTSEHRRDRLPLITREQIADRLRQLRAPKAAPDVLRPRELRRLIRAACRHDTSHSRGGTRRRVAPLVLFVVLTGVRIGEACELEWAWVDLDEAIISLPADATKTRQGREIDLSITPATVALLRALRALRPRDRWVFGTISGNRSRRVPPGTESRMTESAASNWPQRLCEADPTAPPWGWQQLRKTCASFLVSAPRIFRAAAHALEATQLGHSQAVAAGYYVETVRRIAGNARTVEEAMGIAGVARGVVAWLEGLARTGTT